MPIDVKQLRIDANTTTNTIRVTGAKSKPRLEEFRRERDAYAKLPQNPLRDVHAERERKLLAEVAADLPDPEVLAEIRRKVSIGKSERDLLTYLNETGRYVPKDGAMTTELLNLELEKKSERRFRAMSVDEKAKKIAALVDAIGPNGPNAQQAADLAMIDYVHSTVPLTGAARIEHIKAFGGIGNGGEHKPGALELPEKGKERCAELAELDETEKEARLAEALAHMLLHPDAKTPIVVAQDARGLLHDKEQAA